MCACVHEFLCIREEANINPAGRVRSKRISVSPGKSITSKDVQQLALSATPKPKSAGRGRPKKRPSSPEISGEVMIQKRAGRGKPKRREPSPGPSGVLILKITCRCRTQIREMSPGPSGVIIPKRAGRGRPKDTQ